MTVGRRLRSASSAFERGEHPAVVTTLEPLLDDSARWTALGRADSRVAADADYMGGISRLVVGDPDGAAAWLRLATDTPDVPPRIRRALANPFFPVHILLLSWPTCTHPIRYQEVCSIGGWLGCFELGTPSFGRCYPSTNRR